MKKVLLTLMCMAAMMAASTSLKAQEVTITLNPGWTWISCPSTDTLDFATALGSFTPMQGDLIKSKTGNAHYRNGQWLGSISQFYPGYGYMYKSNRTEPVTVTFNEQPSNDHEYVDLGLPSGLLWAACNLGANAPEEYGDYFAWGETTPKDYYGWNTYQYCNGNYNTLTKYCNNPDYGYNGFIDDLTTLLPEDDAATANWGDDWRMPTMEEWQELYNNTACTWTTQNGMNGRLFTASNGNSLFLPAAGGRRDSSLYNEGSEGNYWSCSLNTNRPYVAWSFYFGSGDYYVRSYHNRDYGQSVRPVRSSGQNISYTINATANPEVGGEVSGGGTYAEGTTCTLTATANEGYTFVNWTENGEVVSVDATYSFTVDGDRDLVANFTLSTALMSLSDDFNDGVINPELWTYTGDAVLEEDGLLKLQQNVTDQDVHLRSVSLQIPENGKVIMDRKFMVHHSSAYYNGRNTIQLNGDQNSFVQIEYIYTYYYDDFYHDDPKTGIYLITKLDGVLSEVRLCDVSFDTWLTERVEVDFIAGTLSYYMDTLVATVTISGLVEQTVNYYNVEYGPYGWWTGHYHNMDYVNINVVSEHQYVDLGLPSGTLWATCNVGANAPEEYGDYFAWGETTPKDYYYWDNYQHGVNSSQMIKYCNNPDYGYNGFTDTLTILEPDDDAATANWDIRWRMPTREEWQELLNNTIVTWTTQNGVAGSLFTATNGNSIFLPAAGGIWTSGHQNSDCTMYLSGSLYTDYPECSWGYFGSGWSNQFEMWALDRFTGYPVRPVRSELQNLFHVDALANPVEGGFINGTGFFEQGDTCTLTATANEGYTFTNWTENGEVVSVDATYSFTVNGDRNLVANFANGNVNNLVFNGDFELGNVGFNTDYNYGNTGSYSYYYVGHDIAEMWPWDTPGYPVGDHTTGEGLFMMVDGALEDNSMVWSQTVPVMPNTDYVFSAWFLTNNIGYLRLEINGISGSDFTTPDNSWVWEQQSMTWNSGNSTEATLRIINRFGESGGYDYCIDDIYFGLVNSGGNHEYVDLGLPSGTLWATCNVGADNPEDYGDYFAWGETQPKDTYNWSTYQYCNGGDGWNTLTKYCQNSSYGYNGFTDNLTILEPSDDAATANWGDGWRMPTKAEFEELFGNTTVTWAQQGGVNGCLFTAENGNSLFLPAAGGYGNGNGSDLYYDGDDSNYWSSSLPTDDQYDAWVFYFGSPYYETEMMGNDRNSGNPVRPVRSSSQEMSYTINATANPEVGGEVSGGGTYAEGATCTLTATANEGYTFTNWTENDEVVSVDPSYSFTVNGDRNLVANFTASGGGGDHAYVDLGLPSGLLWATCNVGAETPEDYGDYFAWGETTPKDDYSWSTYQHCNGSSSTLTKYCNNSSYGYNGFTDNMTTLLPEDDVATANWGNGWRMPTKAEFQELLDNTTVVTLVNQNGVDGCLFTAANGNSLFLPAAGYRWNDEFYNVGDNGYYLSSSLTAGNPSLAWNFSNGWDNFYMSNYDRHHGQSVRPVRSSGQNISFVINATPNPAEGGAVSGGGAYAEGATCMLAATASAGYAFANWTENGEVVSVDATYSFTVNGDRNLVANFAVSGGDNHGYVDLGLPSGLLWATCNVGANAPEEYGEYFAWGETTPKDDYSWNTYQYCNGGDEYALTKYCDESDFGYNGFTDNLTTLLPEDDAATANWGSDWRMPTMEEWQEICNNTSHTWTTQNGVNGWLFTASNGNSLFLPAAGHRDDIGLTYTGYEVDYWSSSLNTDYPCNAWVFYFWWEDEYYVGGDNRNKGIPVRPVRSSGQNNAPTGAVNGKFTIDADGDQVYFSQGNLQFQASTNTWKFAENQYDYIGDANSNISQTYSGWMDLFGWGTSGYNHGAICYQPWSASSISIDYYAYGNDQYNLYDQTGQADWGYNLISNGGNIANQWRTLSQPEWDYVFNTRATTSGIRYAKANVNNVNGVILLPDGWSTSTYSLSSTDIFDASFSSNTLTASQWKTLEQAGAVFLPAAGGRNGISVYNVGSIGNYWSASYGNSNYARYVRFSDSGLYTNSSFGRYNGFAVRLVRLAE